MYEIHSTVVVIRVWKFYPKEGFFPQFPLLKWLKEWWLFILSGFLSDSMVCSPSGKSSEPNWTKPKLSQLSNKLRCSNYVIFLFLAYLCSPSYKYTKSRLSLLKHFCHFPDAGAAPLPISSHLRTRAKSDLAALIPEPSCGSTNESICTYTLTKSLVEVEVQFWNVNNS